MPLQTESHKNVDMRHSGELCRRKVQYEIWKYRCQSTSKMQANVLQISSVMSQAKFSQNHGALRRARPRSTSPSRKAFCLTHVRRYLQYHRVSWCAATSLQAEKSLILPPARRSEQVSDAGKACLGWQHGVYSKPPCSRQPLLLVW